jgi:Co/Zn/Cd efflux system component
MTDAAHLLSDVAGFMISIVAIWFGRMNPTDRLSFGYARAEVIGAVLSVFLIWALTGMKLAFCFLLSALCSPLSAFRSLALLSALCSLALFLNPRISRYPAVGGCAAHYRLPL